MTISSSGNKQVATVLTVYGIETFYGPDRSCNQTVATVLTVYGIETWTGGKPPQKNSNLLQQYLPFTVLKHTVGSGWWITVNSPVATVLTVYGIETPCPLLPLHYHLLVATVLTVYGIETNRSLLSFMKTASLQQYLPFTVLKLRHGSAMTSAGVLCRCNSTYRLRYWNKRIKTKSIK